jgi:3-oxoacyl-[acyl-carrier protein] reductase
MYFGGFTKMKLYKKVAIITGGAQGIGKEIARTFASEGANVVLFDINNELVNKTAHTIANQYGVKVIPLVGNIVKYSDFHRAVVTVLNTLSKIDILVNNAGIIKDNLIIRMSEKDWDDVVAINLKGVFNAIKVVSKSMIQNRSGRIINISSVVGQIGNVGQINYSATKGGIIAMTKTCAKELASRNILVNAIAPGFIKTNMTNKLNEVQKQQMCSLIPLARFGDASDIAKAAVFLASDDSSYITGHILSINGGMYM